MRYLRTFDPWMGKYCSCKQKYSLAPYTGCDHRCLYCYITSYIPHAFKCRPKNEFIKGLERDLEKADNSTPISISNSSDPYPTIERDMGLTRETLALLLKHDFKALLVTKSDILTRDLDLLKHDNFAVSMTITSLDDELASILEPGAPAPAKRITAIERLIGSAVPVMVRVDPIIPGLNDDVAPLLSELSDMGVKNITTSTYKARKDSLGRITAAFPGLKTTLEECYLVSGEFINRSWYLSVDERDAIMKNVATTAKKVGLDFNMCREGLSLRRTARSCDGQHLFGL